jgi:glutamine synthetase
LRHAAELDLSGPGRAADRDLLVLIGANLVSTAPSEHPDERLATAAGVGQPGFIARHGLFTDRQASAAELVAARISEMNLRTVRFVVVDQHGQPRSRSLSADAALAALSNGMDFSGAIYSLDTGNNVFVPAFAQGGGFGIEKFTGFPDVVLVPDPTTFQVLPWADRTGWMLCDVYFSDGQPMPLDGRGLMRRALADLGEAGYDYLAGIEVEYYIVKLEPGVLTPENAGFTPPPPPVSVFERGYQFLSEVRLDSVASTLEAIRDALWDVGLPPRSMEDEWGPGQMECTFSPLCGLAAADAVVLFRSTVKQVCQRRGLLATFMCRPGLPNFFSSGWHLHQSLVSLQDGSNAFASDDAPLSELGRQYVAGLIEYALPMMPFSTPTVNGYKRYRPYSFAPDRVCWGVENRGVLVRVQGAPGDTNSHVEMRSGEPAANPYLYMAANIAAGLDGIRRKLEAPPPVEMDPYAAEAPMLPTSLAEAVSALAADDFYRKAFGDTLVDYLLQMKRSEVKRYEAAMAENPPPDGQDVSDWEMREYFEFF